jgi:hypothetical protein
MPGQLDLFGAPRADAEERPAAREGGARGALPTPAAAPAAPEQLTFSEVFAAIAELVQKPERWCQGSAARDARGKPAIPGTREAVRLSAYGAFALLRHEGRVGDTVNMLVWLALNGATPDGEPFARWHDSAHTSHADVLALLGALQRGEQMP